MVVTYSVREGVCSVGVRGHLLIYEDLCFPIGGNFFSEIFAGEQRAVYIVAAGVRLF